MQSHNTDSSSSSTLKPLLTPVKLGALELKNRMIVAPLTRVRAGIDGVSTDMMAEFYSLRAPFGLIISEASSVSSRSNTFSTKTQSSGNIFNADQTAGWKKVVDAVHAKNGLIIAQLWHGGRTTTSSQINQQQPIAPSAIAAGGINRFINEPFEVPHAFTIEEIKNTIEEFRKAAENAKQAGFDGVQLHGANSYLVDEFMKESSNQRTDIYGGNVPNRCRFLLEALDGLISVFGADRVSVRLSPTGRTNGMYDSNPLETLKYLFSEFEKRNLSFVELRRSGQVDINMPLQEGQVKSNVQIPDLFRAARELYKGTIVANDSIDFKEGETLVNEGVANAISFGLLTMSNPDLVSRYEHDYPLAPKIDFDKFYTGTEKGYTDVPLYQQPGQE